jgi:hypothetical protein
VEHEGDCSTFVSRIGLRSLRRRKLFVGVVLRVLRKSIWEESLGSEMKRSGMKVDSDALSSDDCDVVCPFCGEGDFDLVGLKTHFLRGWCDKFNETILYAPHTREARQLTHKKAPNGADGRLTTAEKAKCKAAADLLHGIWAGLPDDVAKELMRKTYP